MKRKTSRRKNNERTPSQAFRYIHAQLIAEIRILRENGLLTDKVKNEFKTLVKRQLGPEIFPEFWNEEFPEDTKEKKMKDIDLATADKKTIEDLAKQYNRRYIAFGLVCIITECAFYITFWNTILTKYVIGIYPLAFWPSFFFGFAIITFKNSLKPSPSKVPNLQEWITKFKEIEKSGTRNCVLQMLAMVGMEYLV